MLGVISGDIIGSPYVNNPRQDTSDIFFQLFASSDRIVIDGERRRARTITYKAHEGVTSALAKAAARWYMSGDRTAESWPVVASAFLEGLHPSPAEALAVCAPLSWLAPSREEATRLVDIILPLISSADLRDAAEHYINMAYALKEGDDAELSAVRESMREAGYSVYGTASEYRPFLDGSLQQGEGHHLTLGDGRTVSDVSLLLPAVSTVLGESRSFEEAIRRAVALGGDSSLLAALTGGLACLRWPVPEALGREALDYLSNEDRRLYNTFTRYLDSRQEVAAGQSSVLQVITVPGMAPVYVFPKDRDDMRKAVAAVNRRLGRGRDGYGVITPEESKALLSRLSEQRDSGGVVLDGTYVEHPRPELKTVWLQDGELRSSTTKEGEAMDGGALPSVDARRRIFNEWNELRGYAAGVRDSLERFALGKEYEHLLEGGAHLHFASAMYPVVRENSIEVWKGDILRARVGINADGRFKVDTSAITGGVHTEGLDGVLSTMNLLGKGDNMKDVRMMLDEFVLDSGRIPDEGERELLEVDDHEGESVRKKYSSNVEAAMRDVSRSLVEGPDGTLTLPVAVQPQGLERSEKTADIVDRMVAESRDRYDGVPYEDIKDSERYKGAVFTIGHSNMKMEDFDRNLRRHGIQVLVDIRSYPESKYAPQFNKETLDGHLLSRDIEYYHFPAFGGKQYGTVRDEKGRASRQLLSYDEIMHTDAFRESMKSLRDCVKHGYRVVLMSSENDPVDSHRMAMMGCALAHPQVYGSKAKPIEVRHITRQGYTLGQDYFETKLCKMYGTEDLGEAYSRRGDELLTKSGESQRASVRHSEGARKAYQERERRQRSKHGIK